MPTANFMKYPHTLQQRLWTLRDVAIPIWPAICTCETKELHTKKQDVLPPPCVQSSWKPRDLSGEQRRMFGILSKGISETIYDFRFMIYELCITDKS